MNQENAPVAQEESVSTETSAPSIETPAVEPAVAHDSGEFTLDEALEAPNPSIPSEAVEDEEVVEKPARHLAHQDYAVSSPITSGTPDKIAIPPDTAAVIEEKMAKAPNMDMIVSEQQHQWAETMRESMFHLPMDDLYTERLNDPSSDFRQSVSFNGTEMRGKSPTHKKKPGEQYAEGERALLQYVTHLGIGGLFRAPMWNSGFWVTFKPATESEMIELNRIIMSDKIQAGRWSYGLALSNTTVYTQNRIFDFILGHVYNTSVLPDEMPIEKLRDWLVPQDLQSFIWGFLCSNYPSGFHYETGCINDAAKCTHLIKENLNVSKLQWTDNAALTDWQKQHMASMGANTRTLASVKQYQETMAKNQKRRIVLEQGSSHEIAFTIKTPTVAQYIEQGHRWISGLVENVNAVLGMDASADARNTQINKLTKATTLCQYIHWIEEIEYGELTTLSETPDQRSISKVIDRASIERLLVANSAVDSLREGMIEAVLKYINDTTVSVIGVPAFDCPICQHPQDGAKTFPRHTSIIPLDLIQVFFALMGQRLNRIETRFNR